MQITIITILFWLSPNRLLKLGINCKPSTAEVTVTAGVSIPSASKAEPPIIAGIISHLACLRTKVKREKIPPSPLLSAFNVINTYFIVVKIVSVQNTRDKVPRIKSSETLCRPPLLCITDLIT